MDEYGVVGIVVAFLVPTAISVIALWMQSQSGSKEGQREYIQAVAKLTEATVRLKDTMEMLANDNARQDTRIEKCEERLDCLEHDMTVVQTDIYHYHEDKG